MSRLIERAIHAGDGNPALLDTATGALSSAAFTLRVEEAAALASRLGHGLSAVAVEILHPFALCGTFGIDAVDAVLAEMVDRMWALARRSDTVARLGPARLAVLLPATDPEGAERYARRVGAYLEGTPYRLHTGEARIELSLTVAGAAAGQQPSAAAMLRDLQCEEHWRCA